MSTQVLAFLKFLFLGLIPPDRPDNPTPAQLARYGKLKKRWAYFVAFSLWVGLATLVALLLPTYGFLPSKFDRVAWGADLRQEVNPVVQRVAEMQKELIDVGRKTDALLLSQLRVELRDTRAKQCRAIADHDAERKDTYGRMMEDLLTQYEQLNGGKAWPVPGCEEL